MHHVARGELAIAEVEGDAFTQEEGPFLNQVYVMRHQRISIRFNLREYGLRYLMIHPCFFQYGRHSSNSSLVWIDALSMTMQTLFEPFGITRFYTDGWGAYERYIDPEQHQVRKENAQKIESKHINLRTRIKRLVRRTICFSKTTTRHDHSVTYPRTDCKRPC